MNNQRTPSKNNVFPGFSPVLCKYPDIQYFNYHTCFSVLQSPVTSPQKNLTGHPRIVRDIVADLYNNIQKWNNLHIQGSQIVKQIAIMKSESLGCYSPELEQQTNDLYMTMQNIDSYVKVLEKLNNQINALVKLQTRKEVLFLSCSLQEIMQYIEIITNAYFKEYKVRFFLILV